MEPMKEAISVRLAKLNNQFLGKQQLLGFSSNAYKRALHKEGLLDALTVLYDECNNENLIKNDEQISKFVDKYRHILAELRRMRVNVNDFEVKDIIGKGHFGVVHVVKEKHTGDVYAMKTLRKDDMLKQTGVAFYEEERDIMAFSSSSWIVNLHYAFQDSTNLYLMMEYCVGGDLSTLLERRGILDTSQAVFYLAQINQALAALHNMGYLHRDLKPQNVLIDRCGHLKLGDFGSATQLNKSGKAATAVPIGTLQYMAPELLRSLQDDTPTVHGTAVDYWSLGIIAYELVTTQRPFSGDTPAQALTALDRYSSRDNRINYPAGLHIPEAYKDLITSLLNMDPKKRFNYLETLRHPVFRDIPWNTLRDQVPPFVPIVASPEDVSNFLECSKEKSRPNPSIFRSRNAFSGRNLPFIGFTYACEHWNGDVEASEASTSCESGSAGGFGDTLSTTAVQLPTSSAREEALRQREFDNLRSRLVDAESRACEANSRATDAEAKAANAKADRDRLRHDLMQSETQIQQLAKQNHKLKRKLECDSKERKDLESKSIELISAAKTKWVTQSNSQIEELNTKIRSKESRILSLERENNRIKSKMAETVQSLERANNELNCLKKLQTNYKDTMAKARSISRQSIVGLEQVSTDSANQIQTLTSNLDLERRAKSAALSKIEEAERECKRMQVELAECRKDYEDLKKTYNKLEIEKAKLECGAKQLETRYERLEKSDNERITAMETRLASEREKCAALKVQLEEMTRRITEHERREHELELQHERTECRLREKLDEWDSERVQALAELHTARTSDERHRDKVSELECLVMRLEQDVSKLELERETTSQSTADLTAHAQMELLKEQLSKMESQLEKSREEAIALKLEARKANTSLWKKEKEFSDLELDKRILTREAKQLEEKVKKITEEKALLTSSYIESKRELEEQLAKKTDELVTTKRELESLKRDVARKEREGKTLESQLSARSHESERKEGEIDRYKNDIKKMKCELQYSENRRIKFESEVNELREEIKRLEEDRMSVREQNASLKTALHERTSQADTLQTNYKMLQDACTMLEEQLVDFEKLSDIWEQKNQTLQVELEKLSSELDEANEKASSAESVLAEYQRQVEQLKLEDQAWREQARDAQQMIDHLQQRLSERESRIADLESELHEVQDDRVSYERRVTVQEARMAQLHEESSALLTAVHQLKQDNSQLKRKLEDVQEELTQYRCEQEAAAAWWKARETKAEATLRQQAKLIDFLQVKVEEYDRKRSKKTLGTMLFGKSTPSTPIQTPSRENCDPKRLLTVERQANRELREELARLKQKLNSSALPRDKQRSAVLNEITNTPKVRKVLSLTSCCEDEKSVDKFEGWLQIHRKTSSERIKATAEALELKWRDSAGDELARLFAHNVTASHPLGHALSPSQRDRAFVVTSQPTGEQILCVAETLEEKALFLDYLFKKSNDFNAEVCALVKLLGCEITCALEVEDSILAIGTDKGLFSYKKGEEKPVLIEGTGPVTWLRASHSVVALASTSRNGVAYCSRALLGSVLKRAACLKPRLEMQDLNISHGVSVVELMSSRYSNEREMLAVASETKISIFKYESQSCRFSLQKTLNLTTQALSLLFTPHSLLIGTHKLYEIDLARYTCEEFLDASDQSLQSATYAYKNNCHPLSIIRIKDRNVDTEYEYLICYNEFGVFVDEFGRRSRSEDVKWKSTPSKWVYRKPYLFIVQQDRVEIVKLEENSYKLPPCDCDGKSTTSNVSEYYVQKCNVNMACPIFLGKSLHSGTIYLRIGKNVDEYTLVALSGDAAFKKMGVSVETLFTIDDTDSCKNLPMTGDQTDAPESDRISLSSTDSSEPASTFLADIRRKAKQLKKKDTKSKFKPSVKKVDEVISEAKSIDCPDGKMSSEESGECHLVGKTTAEICGQMFVEKQVKFNGK